MAGATHSYLILFAKLKPLRLVAAGSLTEQCKLLQAVNRQNRTRRRWPLTDPVSALININNASKQNGAQRDKARITNHVPRAA